MHMTLLYEFQQYYYRSLCSILFNWHIQLKFSLNVKVLDENQVLGNSELHYNLWSIFSEQFDLLELLHHFEASNG